MHSKNHSKNHSKVSGIIIKREPNNSGSLISKSWNGFGHLDRPFNKAQDYFGQSRLTRSNNHRPGKKKSQMEKISGIYNIDYKPYDAVSNCKSAGVIPYAIVNGQLLFLFQISPLISLFFSEQRKRELPKTLGPRGHPIRGVIAPPN